MIASKLRNLSIDELKQREMDLRKELFNLRAQLSKGELPNTMRVCAVRKDIVRVLGMITEKGKGA